MEVEEAALVRRQNATERNVMGLILVLLLLALLFTGLGFVYPFLWIVAVVLFVLWAVGFGRSRRHAAA
jgi:hypothetical protein